jgi:hypothetical protein
MDPEGKHGYKIASCTSAYKEEHSGKDYTMDDLVIVFNGKIWDFKDVILSDVTRDRLEVCAKELYKVCYFK